MKAALNGQTLTYGTGGSTLQAESETLVFVHGAGFDHAVWTPMARYFARHGLNVVAPDLPGHGGSDGPACRTIEAMADVICELLDYLELDQASVVGHSMGTLVALAMAQRSPQHVQQLVLLGTSNPMPVGPPLLAAAADGHHAAIEMANTFSHSRRGMLGASANPGLHGFNAAQRWMEHLPAGVFHQDLTACNDFRLAVENCAIPTLVLIGEADKMTPANAGQSVASQLSNAHVHTLKGCGHAMLTEQPNEVLDAVSKFVLG
ncbi:MAG: alpha/beta hydrolase [Pseudomonadaceae bacterium]|nr:alpha/beta hydrolase [Pseudomonadaceae bacterium]